MPLNAPRAMLACLALCVCMLTRACIPVNVHLVCREKRGGNHSL